MLVSTESNTMTLWARNHFVASGCHPAQKIIAAEFQFVFQPFPLPPIMSRPEDIL